MTKAEDMAHLLCHRCLEVPAVPAHVKDATIEGPRQHDQHPTERRGENGRFGEADQRAFEAHLLGSHAGIDREHAVLLDDNMLSDSLFDVDCE
eukprot:CAMPEP_0115864298 /NCGR_PEP_ID=MMETSP0287-20121206/19129_1 /TAXON_ID=412157 /ORGANISM="Chrysochromulina rotalis, Strain UIO044" /LENGTH=92 /DNA_ID=CAMNT_0003318765 /DNA_START=874 /DNA_END=1152 /DNA_ORIENTATION=+